jgi:hypothetical protein
MCLDGEELAANLAFLKVKSLLSRELYHTQARIKKPDPKSLLVLAIFWHEAK